MNAHRNETAACTESVYGTILFDGQCNLCNQSVDFVIRNNAAGNLRFSPLSSETGRRLLREYGVTTPPERFDSVVFIWQGKIYTHSDAALQIARHLDGCWPVMGAFLILPRGARDVVYRFIARNRYRWFGKTEACRLPTPELMSRFLS